MIHIATVHWVDPRWIDIQIGAFRRHLRVPYRVYANLEGIDDPAWDRRFEHSTRSPGSHPDKLNALAGAISEQAAPDDLLVFIDGDAFPVRPLDGWLQGLLASAPLAAVRRDENLGDRQPHPCFCVTTARFWRELPGDWNAAAWTNSRGEEVRDNGGLLLARLEEKGVVWTPILRSNRRNAHPILFGIYDGHIYHHGAGFRAPATRADADPAARFDELEAVRRASLQSVRSVRPRHLRTVVRAARQRAVAARQRRRFDVMRKESDRIYRHIVADDGFFRWFEAPAGSSPFSRRAARPDAS
ncbi:MAG TPA: hypothetical protein VKI19_02855 [Acidimicrobiales bacterium]|nr:hypothetical protein [Acidimicrobiales bacterium]